MGTGVAPTLSVGGKSDLATEGTESTDTIRIVLCDLRAIRGEHGYE